MRHAANMSKRELIATHRKAILELAAKHGAVDVRLFGSVARGEEAPESDVDLLVKFEGATGFEAFGQQVAFEEAVSQLLACPTHVVSDHQYLRPRFRKGIEADLRPI